MGEIDIFSAWNASVNTLTKGKIESQQSILESAEAWRIATEYLDPVRRIFSEPNHVCSVPTLQALRRIAEIQLSDALLRHYFSSIESNFSLVAADVNEYLTEWNRLPDPAIISNLLHCIGTWMQIWQKPVDSFWPTSNHVNSYRSHFLTLLYAILPSSFSPALTSYLRRLIHDPALTPLPPSLAMPTLIALLDRYDTLLFALLYEEIESKVIESCAKEFSESKLESLVHWLNSEVMTCLSNIYSGAVESGREEARKMLKPTFGRFEYHLYKVLGQLRTRELFDIIIEYPRSQAALQDLAVCLQKTDQRTAVVVHLKSIIRTRLLHPGADTKFIIDVYISTIRSLRLLDPQGVLLSRVADPLRRYLRSRDDTIRCVVALLTDEASDLFWELSSTSHQVTTAPVHDSKDAAEDYNDPKWLPDPVDAPIDFRKSKGSDIIQSLVTIYDTKDVFIKELQVRIAQQLIAIRNYALQREVKTVQILKKRFGEASLQGCEVMIKDLQESQRIDQSIHERVEVPIHATIVSRLFWPSFQTTPLKLPGQLGRQQLEYERTFIGLKPDKKLRWLPQLGTINITVELSDRSMTLDVNPLQASLIELFSARELWTSDDLANELRITDSTVVLNGLYFWNNLGVVKNVEDGWKLLEVKEESKDAGVAHIVEDNVQAVQSVEALQIEQMSIYSSYIVGMLGNLKAMPLARIHTMLSTLVTSYKGHTTDELLAFLNSMEEQGLVMKGVNGNWSVQKK